MNSEQTRKKATKKNPVKFIAYQTSYNFFGASLILFELFSAEFWNREPQLIDSLSDKLG